MCISFYDVELSRQEEIAVEAHRLASHEHDRWWGFRAERFDQYLRDDVYGTMEPADLKEHIAVIRTAHPNDDQWLALADMAEDVLTAWLAV